MDGQVTSLRLASSLSWTDWFSRFCLSFSRSSSSRAFFSSSVRGAISSVDSEKSVCSLCTWEVSIRIQARLDKVATDVLVA